jgi:hypothetical protein
MMQTSPAEEGRVTMIFDRIVKWVSSGLSFDTHARQLVFNLKVNSKPMPGALFTLLYTDGKRYKEIGTDDTIRGVYRGLYKYKISMKGYQDDTNDLDLEFWSWKDSGITCHLVVSPDDTHIPCS